MSSVAHPLTASPGAAPQTAAAAPGRTLGLTYVVCVPLLAGVATVRGVDVGGFNYSGFLWVSAFAGGVLLLLVDLAIQPRPRIAFPVVLWLPWVGYLGLSLFWADEPTYAQVQSWRCK